VTALCAVFDFPTQAPLWRKARHPTELGAEVPVQVAAADPVADPVARVALKRLTSFVNLSTGLVSSRDRSYAIDVLKALKIGRRRLAPDDAYAWAVQHGWRTDGATELRELVIGVAAGKRYRGGGLLGLPSQMLAMWERDAAEGQK
jgi:hypothetical protein